jgi:hypothetical protein
MYVLGSRYALWILLLVQAFCTLTFVGYTLSFMYLYYVYRHQIAYRETAVAHLHFIRKNKKNPKGGLEKF